MSIDTLAVNTVTKPTGSAEVQHLVLVFAVHKIGRLSPFEISLLLCDLRHNIKCQLGGTWRAHNITYRFHRTSKTRTGSCTPQRTGHVTKPLIISFLHRTLYLNSKLRNSSTNTRRRHRICKNNHKSLFY